MLGRGEQFPGLNLKSLLEMQESQLKQMEAAPWTTLGLC